MEEEEWDIAGMIGNNKTKTIPQKSRARRDENSDSASESSDFE